MEKRKRREKLLKEIMNNYDEKDKVKTHKFLQRFGLTEKEAIKYT